MASRILLPIMKHRLGLNGHLPVARLDPSRRSRPPLDDKANFGVSTLSDPGQGAANTVAGVRSEFWPAGSSFWSGAHPVAYSRCVIKKLKAGGFDDCRPNVLIIEVVRHAVLVNRWATPPIA